MAETQPRATITPSFREFLPAWVARQPWYRGPATPTMRLVGGFRLEDPAGRVGIQTHLLHDGTTVYQVPMTYRGAPLGDVSPIVVAEHSILGTRWIYDAPDDPVWVAEMLRLVRTGGVTDETRAMGGAVARGRVLAPREWRDEAAVIEVVRVPEPGVPGADPDIVGCVTGTWRPDQDVAFVTGCLATVRVPATRAG